MDKLKNLVFMGESDAKKLKKEYDNAVKDSKKTFIFEGRELLTDYAKYLLEFLKMNEYKLD
jgi:hypothetical protein